MQGKGEASDLVFPYKGSMFSDCISNEIVAVWSSVTRHLRLAAGRPALLIQCTIFSPEVLRHFVDLKNRKIRMMIGCRLH